MSVLPGPRLTAVLAAVALAVVGCSRGGTSTTPDPNPTARDRAEALFRADTRWYAVSPPTLEDLRTLEVEPIRRHGTLAGYSVEYLDDLGATYLDITAAPGPAAPCRAGVTHTDGDVDVAPTAYRTTCTRYGDRAVLRTVTDLLPSGEVDHRHGHEPGQLLEVTDDDTVVRVAFGFNRARHPSPAVTVAEILARLHRVDPARFTLDQYVAGLTYEDD